MVRGSSSTRSICCPLMRCSMGPWALGALCMMRCRVPMHASRGSTTPATMTGVWAPAGHDHDGDDDKTWTGARLELDSTKIGRQEPPDSN